MVKRIFAPLLAKLHLSSEMSGEPSLFRKILLPLDGSVLAEEALPYAIAQAQRFAARLVLLKVIPPLLEARSPHKEVVVAAEVKRELTPAAEKHAQPVFLWRLSVSKAAAVRGAHRRLSTMPLKMKLT